MDLGNTTINLGYGMSQMPYRPNIKINKLHDDAHLPTYGSANAACADLYAYIGFDDATMVNKNGDRCIMIQPHETVKVHTGLRMAPPEGWYIQGFARSGLSTKQGLAPVCMKYYTVESHYEKEAPFGIAWQVKLFDGHTLLEEYNHIFYNEIAGYCKCLEDMGFIENVEVKLDIESELKKLQDFQKSIDEITAKAAMLENPAKSVETPSIRTKYSFW